MLNKYFQLLHIKVKKKYWDIDEEGFKKPSINNELLEKRGLGWSESETQLWMKQTGDVDRHKYSIINGPQVAYKRN